MTLARGTKFVKAILVGSLLAVVAGCSALGLGDDEVTVYRMLDAKKNGQASLSPSQFRFNPTLSTFDEPVGEKPWMFLFTVDTSGATWTVEGLDPHLFSAELDEPPDGHYSIVHDDSITADEAKKMVSDYAKANPDRIEENPD